MLLGRLRGGFLDWFVRCASLRRTPLREVGIDGRIEVSGAAKLITAANAWLNAKGGIHLPAGKKLTVCGSGPDDCVKTTLSAAESIPDNCAGIGGNNGES